VFRSADPLSEFWEPAVMHNYGVRCDAEVLDMLDTAARQLEVRVYAFGSFHFLKKRSFDRSRTEEYELTGYVLCSWLTNDEQLKVVAKIY
jgi:hypothetical protein